MRAPMPRMTLSRRSKIIIAVVAAIIVLLMALSSLTGVYVNWLWFKSVGYAGTYRTVFWTRVVLFLIFGVIAVAVVVGNVLLAYRLRPAYRPVSPEQQNLERYRVSVDPYRRWIIAGLSVFTFLGAGMAGQSQWQVWQLFLHGGRFGITDPQFRKDISFYAWDYPAYRAVLGLGFTTMIFAFVLAAGVHYFTGAIRLQTAGQKVSPIARRHLTLVAFVFIIFKAMAYWLDRYGLVFSDRSTFTGASYTDVHASLPSKTILFWIAILLALGLLASLWLKSSLLPGVAFVSMLVLSILISGIYPAILQQVSVKPNASSLEAKYIKRNIFATREAYGIQSVTSSAGSGAGQVAYQSYQVDAAPSASSLDATNPTVQSIRILDPNVLSATFTQQQQIRSVYGFADKLDVDRYTLPQTTAGKTAEVDNDYVVGVRELDESNLQGNQTNWINQHTVFTHGYGFVAAAANADVTTKAAPYTEGNIPPAGPLGLTQPDVYFGELMPNYSIVGAKGTAQEYDGSDSAKITYGGSGGVSLSSLMTRLALAVQYKQTNFLLNDAVSASGAKIIFNRDPRQMVQKVAPFLKVDSDPVPFVDSSTGHIMWMVDAYTTMDDFPYSQRNSLSDLTSDSLSSSGKTARQPNDTINYIRNSVKATVDAYTGKITLYRWDKSDPVLAAWMKIFPHLITTKAMPTSVLDHVRYPEDLFEVQRSLIGTYHVSDPVKFYNVGDKWTVPNDPTDKTANQPPYYVLASPADGSSTTAQFQLTSPMLVNGKANLAAYISVDCDPGPDYGKFTVLTVPPGTQTNGPSQVFNILTSNTTISRDLTQFNGAGGGSQVVHGNLLTLPIGNSFLYVEPLYLQGTQSTGSYPTLGRVLVVYGDNVGYAPTLAGALENLGESTVGKDLQNSGGTGGTPSTGSSSTPTTTPSSSSSPSRTGTSSPTLQQLIKQLDTANAALQAAYATGDPATIAKAQGTVLALVKQIATLETSSAGTPKPSASR